MNQTNVIKRSYSDLTVTTMLQEDDSVLVHTETVDNESLTEYTFENFVKVYLSMSFALKEFCLQNKGYVKLLRDLKLETIKIETNKL